MSSIIDVMTLLMGAIAGMVVTLVVFTALVSKRREERDAAQAECETWKSKHALATSNGADLAHLVKWSKRKLMNWSEFQLYLDLEAMVGQGRGGHRLFTQVAFGAFIKAELPQTVTDTTIAACHSVHRKIADFLLIDRAGLPVAVIEYQGAGHYQGTAHARDMAKRVACQKAGILFMEVPATGLTHGQRVDLRRLLGIPTQLAAE